MNEYWREIINLPIKKENIKIEPFHYLVNEKAKYLNNKKVQNSLVVISQAAITEQFARFILNNFNLFQNMKISYKLHPAEYQRWDRNAALVSLNKKDITIVFDNNLYQLFSVSEYQLGVFSTALYEGVEFGCKTILADFAQNEYMDKFIKYHHLGKKNGFYGNINKYHRILCDLLFLFLFVGLSIHPFFVKEVSYLLVYVKYIARLGLIVFFFKLILSVFLNIRINKIAWVLFLVLLFIIILSIYSIQIYNIEDYSSPLVVFIFCFILIFTL